MNFVILVGAILLSCLFCDGIASSVLSLQKEKSSLKEDTTEGGVFV
jgi:hypothetical protein